MDTKNETGPVAKDTEGQRWAVECYKKATAEVAESRRRADLPLENLRAAWKVATDHQRAAFLGEVGAFAEEDLPYVCDVVRNNQ